MSHPWPRSHVAFIRIALPLLLLASMTLRAQTRDFAILYHERLQELSFVEGRERPQAAGSTQPSTPSLSFGAFGRRFDVDLRRNDRITSTLDADARARLSGVDVYQGEVRDATRSWARLTRYGDQWTGVISDGADLYVVEPYASAAPYLALPGDATRNEPIIYRWKDAVGPVVDEIGPIISSPGAATSQDVKPLALPPASVEQIDIGLVGDTPFGQQPNGMSPEAAMISMANIADGIFVTQVGVHLNVAQIESFANSTDPFDSTDPSTLLSELANHKAATTTLAGQGLVHLFTGRDFGSSVAGVAYLGSVCSGSHAAGLTRVTGLGSGGLIAAHEIGHNFGAPHDAEAGSACESTPSGYLMSTTFNGSDQFSACSLQQMQPVIASASCLYAVPPSDISLRTVNTPSQILLGLSGFFDLAIDGHGADAFDISANAVGDGLHVNSVSYMHCGYSSPPGCLAASLSDGQSMSLSIDATAERVGRASLDVYVQSVNDSNPLNNSLHFDVDVLPTVNLLVDTTDATPWYIYPNGTVDIAFGFSNQGSVPATQVTARVHLDIGLEVLDISSSAGACTKQGDPTLDWDCPIGSLAPGISQRITLKLRDETGRLGQRSVFLFLDTAEVNFGAHSSEATFPVVSALADLSVSINSAAQQGPGVLKGERFEVTVKGHNAGPDAAANVKLDFSDLSGVIAIDKFDGASCAPRSYDPSHTDCMFGTVAGGVDFAVTLSGIAQGFGGNVSASISSDATDPDSSNDSENVQLLVFQAPPQQTSPPPSTTTPPPATSGGGGGAIDWPSAVLLAAALAWHRRLRTLLARDPMCRSRASR